MITWIHEDGTTTTFPHPADHLVVMSHAERQHLLNLQSLRMALEERHQAHPHQALADRIAEINLELERLA